MVKSCAEYYELISAYMDNELDEEDRAKVERHVESCPHCRGLLRAYSGIAYMVEDTMEDPPEPIRRHIMAEISKPAKRKVIRRFTLPRAAAALIPLAAGFLLVMVLMLRTDGALPTALQEYGISPAVMMDDGDFTMGAMIPPGELAQEAEEDSAWRVGSARGDVSPQAVIPPVPMTGDVIIESEDVSPFDQYGLGRQLFDEDDDTRFYAIVFIDGEVPDILTGFEPYVTGCGNLFTIIPRELVAELLGQPGVTVEIRNEEAGYAKVIF